MDVDRPVTIAPYDWLGRGEPPQEGDYIAGTRSAYLVLEMRKVDSPKHPHRYRAFCLKLGAGKSAIPQGAKVYTVAWYPRRGHLHRAA